MSGLRYIEPVPPHRAMGLVADVYRAIRRDFGVLGDVRNGRSPFIAHAPVPDLLAAAWSVLYETMLVGRVPRATKESVAATISTLNACPFCAETHTMMAAGATGKGDHEVAPIVEWARATRSPHSGLLASPPFDPDKAPEILTTALLFHYINRVVSVFLGEAGVLPASGPPRRAMEAAMTGYFRYRSKRRPDVGASLDLLPDVVAAPAPDWAANAPAIAIALGRFETVIDSAARSTLSSAVRDRLDVTLQNWDGSDPGISRAWLEDGVTDLRGQDRDVTQLLLLTALAPYRLSEDDVSRFRRHHPSDAELVAAVCWAAFTAARRTSEWWAHPTGDASEAS